LTEFRLLYHILYDIITLVPSLRSSLYCLYCLYQSPNDRLISVRMIYERHDMRGFQRQILEEQAPPVFSGSTPAPRSSHYGKVSSGLHRTLDIKAVCQDTLCDRVSAFILLKSFGNKRDAFSPYHPHMDACFIWMFDRSV